MTGINRAEHLPCPLCGGQADLLSKSTPDQLPRLMTGDGRSLRYDLKDLFFACGSCEWAVDVLEYVKGEGQ